MRTVDGKQEISLTITRAIKLQSYNYWCMTACLAFLCIGMQDKGSADLSWRCFVLIAGTLFVNAVASQGETEDDTGVS